MISIYRGNTGNAEALTAMFQAIIAITGLEGGASSSGKRVEPPIGNRWVRRPTAKAHDRFGFAPASGARLH